MLAREELLCVPCRGTWRAAVSGARKEECSEGARTQREEEPHSPPGVGSPPSHLRVRLAVETLGIMLQRTRRPTLLLAVISVPAACSACAFEPIARANASPRPFVATYNLWDTQVPYADALEWQRSLQKERVASLLDSSTTATDSVILLQHPPVLTLGTRSTLDNLRTDDPPFELFRTERGGEVTYHGPGQLVLYPILDLRDYRQDVHWYMRALEEVVIRTLHSLGLPAEREPGLTGVWVNGAKACAEGVKLSRWVTMHGLALNVHTDLSDFQHIVPCGIGDRPVTSVAEQLRAAGTPEDDLPTLEDVQRLLLGHFADVFECQLVEAAPDEGETQVPSGVRSSCVLCP